jgi:uncharacterized repeat protein (TIGR03833 family)
MPRNGASGANKQRRRPPKESTDTDKRRQFKAQPGHPDPNVRLDGQSKEQSFAHLERTKETVRVVGVQGWKIGDGKKAITGKTTTQDDVWDHFWGDTTTETIQFSTSSNLSTPEPRSTNPPPLISRTATPELPKYHPSIPKSMSVVPGKSVDIVLKQDQGTGRTVNGIISQVLSRGNHPWGIKVKLTDGRVGRVQKVH